MDGTSATRESELERLLEFLGRSRGFDFTAYKRPSLMRRIDRRMQDVGVSSYGDYIDFLEVHPEEFPQLFNAILINVTAFFRDPPAWELLRKSVVPELLGSKASDAPIRLWSAGCASGEEAYSLAMLLAESLGPEAFLARVKIYATDVDEEALAQARQASYTERDVAELPPELLSKYFERNAARYLFHRDLRRAVIFGRHDLIQDAPISRIDLLFCRNTLMYFNADAQSEILARLHFALRDGGVLFLGKAELLLRHSSLFTPLDAKIRLFRKVAQTAPRERPVRPASDAADPVDDAAGEGRQQAMRASAFEVTPVAQIVVDWDGRLAVANEKARIVFGIGPGDIGRPLQDLELSYRPLELRSLVDQVRADGQALSVKGVSRRTPAGEGFLDVHVLPMRDAAGNPFGVQIGFFDATPYRALQDELRTARVELDAAHEELQSTSEELETTNEELQSTVEELETTNEELQSTNEELETMNEELQSTNEELQTMNDEMTGRGDELHRVNGFLNSILAGLDSGVVVLDREMFVQVWNHKCEDMWGLRSEEVMSKNFLGLDVGLPVDRLKAAIRGCLAGESDHHEMVLAATNRRGRSIQCKVTVTCTALAAVGESRSGVILLIEEMARSEGTQDDGRS